MRDEAANALDIGLRGGPHLEKPLHVAAATICNGLVGPVTGCPDLMTADWLSVRAGWLRDGALIAYADLLNVRPDSTHRGCAHDQSLRPV